MSDLPVIPIRGRSGTKDAEASSQRSSFHRLEYLAIEDGKSKDIRFLIDAEDAMLDETTGRYVNLPANWNDDQRQAFADNSVAALAADPTSVPKYLAGYRTFSLHIMAPTRPAPDNYQGKWPQKITSTCRHDVSLRHIYSDCYICANYTEKGKPFPAKDRTWSLAVMREQVIENGAFVGMRDVMEEVSEKDANGVEVKRMIPKIVIVQFAYNNFWSTFGSILSMYGTLLSRDFRIKRTGTELATAYSPAPFDVVPDPLGKFDSLDLRIPAIRARYDIPNLDALIFDRSTDEFYAMWYDTTKPHPDRKTAVAEGAVAASASDVAVSELEAMQARLTVMTPPVMPVVGQTIPVA